MLHPIEIKRTANPGAELVRPFKLLDKASGPRDKDAIYENIVGEMFVKQGCDLHFYRNEKVKPGGMDFLVRDLDSLVPAEGTAKDRANVGRLF